MLFPAPQFIISSEWLSVSSGTPLHTSSPPTSDHSSRKPISLISHSDVRYRGILAGIDAQASTIQLSNGE